MSEPRGTSRNDRDHDVDGFRGLIDRPTPELDPSSLWRGIESRLTDRAATADSATAWAAGMTFGRLAWGAAAMLVVVVASWATFVGPAPDTAPQIVLLAPPRPDAPAPDASAAGAEGSTGTQPAEARLPAEAGAAAAQEAPLELDVRLVRGYDGVAPDDVESRPAGAGGADALQDARASIESLLPYESFGLVGRAEVELGDDAALEIVLSGDYRLLTRSAETETAARRTVLLEGLELVGIGQESTPVDLSLEPGRLYILGVLPGGVEDPELVLLIRARTRRGGDR